MGKSLFVGFLIVLSAAAVILFIIVGVPWIYGLLVSIFGHDMAFGITIIGGILVMLACALVGNKESGEE